MSNNQNVKHEIIRETLRDWPGMPTKTAARLAYNANPQVFGTLGSAYSIARYIRGAKGSAMRSKLADKSQVRDAGIPFDPFGKLPTPKSEWDAPWCAVEIECPAKILVMSDAHIPYFHPAAIRCALQTGKDRGCDVVLLNGDTWDAFAVSQWVKDPRQRDMPGEVNDVQQFLGVVRETFPNARIIFKVGNHEERWIRYLILKAPDVLGIKQFELGAVLGLDKIGATLVDDMRPMKAGKLFIIHGHEYRFNISNPVNAARGFFLRAKTHCLGGHLHRSSQHSESALDGNVISTFSAGCLCDLHPSYSPLNQWNHGFAVVEVDQGGAFRVDNLRVIDGKAW